MRVELKQWLRSHWGEMSANDRAKFPEQTLFLSPGGAGITSMREQYEHWLQILMMVSGFVLLIVCANVANLMLVRGMERRRQTSLSMALGARASRLVRQALTESILLSLLGGAAGLAIAFAGTRLILHFAFPTVSGMRRHTHQRVAFHAGAAVRLRRFASRREWLSASLPHGWPRGSIRSKRFAEPAAPPLARARSRGRHWWCSRRRSRWFCCQRQDCSPTALHRLENQDFGFDQDRRVVVNIDPRLAGYRPEQLTPLYRRIHDSLSSIPGVSAVALCIYSPLNGNNWGGGVWVDGHPAPGPNDDNSAFWDRVTAGYFDVIGNPIVRGRGITEQDTATSRHVAVINEAFARKFFKKEDPIGKHFGRTGMEASRQYEIVGIAKDARYLTYNLDKPTDPFYFLPEAQHDVSPDDGFMEISPGSHFLHDIVIVTRPGASLSVAQVRQAMASVDPNLPIISIHSLREQVAGQFSQQRLIARLTSFFGAFALILASIGVYGVTAYNAGSRTNEIGVRMALGADRSDVFALVLRGALALISFGLLLGIPLTLAAGRFLGNQLYGINPYDPLIIAVAILVLGCSALTAALIPAFRASSISPLQALRAD